MVITGEGHGSTDALMLSMACKCLIFLLAIADVLMLSVIVRNVGEKNVLMFLNGKY